jgi:hypothetical protein
MKRKFQIGKVEIIDPILWLEFGAIRKEFS